MRSSNSTCVEDHTRRQYLNHIRRLQAQNATLAEMLADERKQRQDAYAWYRKRLQSRFWLVMEMIAEVYRVRNESPRERGR